MHAYEGALWGACWACAKGVRARVHAYEGALWGACWACAKGVRARVHAYEGARGEAGRGRCSNIAPEPCKEEVQDPESNFKKSTFPL